MHRDFDQNLDQAIDLKATPPLARGLALGIALALVGLLGWYGYAAKSRQDAAAAAKAAKAAAKHNSAAEAQK